MNLYVITCVDWADSLELRQATRPAHLEFLASSPNVKIAGPYLNETGGMAGSMLIIEAESLQHAQAFATADPYAKAGLFEKSEVRAWRQTAGRSTL